jgi:hypothetical protein
MGEESVRGLEGGAVLVALKCFNSKLEFHFGYQLVMSLHDTREGMKRTLPLPPRGEGASVSRRTGEGGLPTFSRQDLMWPVTTRKVPLITSSSQQKRRESFLSVL